MYTSSDKAREKNIAVLDRPYIEPYRHPFQRDISRLMHAPSFRRLQGKTQLFPCHESDFFRNRLTHSLEVAQLSESIAYRVNFLLKEKGSEVKISPSVCRFASLAHDLGHPPFGHLGEEVLNLKMHGYGGFEGNAQTLRILTQLEEVEMQEVNASMIGLNLCYRSLASILKYDSVLLTKQTNEDLSNHKVLKPNKGYYDSENDLVQRIKCKVAPGYNEKFKTVECAIMDISDDISNAVYDLEDAFRGGFCSPLEIVSAHGVTWEKTAAKVKSAMEEQDRYMKKESDRSDITAEFVKNIIVDLISAYLGLVDTVESKQQQSSLGIATNACIRSELYARDGAARTSFTSYLIGKFVRGINIEFNKDMPSMSKVYIKDEDKILVDALKNLTYEFQIESRKLRIVAIRGIEIVSAIFDAINNDEGYLLMPDCFIRDYKKGGNKDEKMRVICDFVAGMTDRYAIEFYGRLKSENAETIFKPF